MEPVLPISWLSSSLPFPESLLKVEGGGWRCDYYVHYSVLHPEMVVADLAQTSAWTKKFFQLVRINVILYYGR